MAKQQKDYNGIISDYLDGMIPKEIAIKYKLNNATYVYDILKKNNIKTQRNVQWTPELVKLLKIHYPSTEWEELLELFKPHSRDNIIHKACKLKISRLLNAEWSEEDITILKEYYGKVSSKELQYLLQYRSESSINTKASRLGLESREKWTDEEIEKLRKLYPYYFNSELSRMFNNRTASAIMSMAMKLNIIKDKDSHLFALYNKETLILEFQDFAKELGRTPISIEISANKNMAHHMTYVRYFGSYTNACKEAGLVPCYDNSLYVTHVYYSNNNDLCLSQAELQITNLFINNGVKYQKEVMYRDLVKDDYSGFKRCDWVVENIVVEYFGMPERESYQKRIVEKRELCAKNDIQLLELYPEDIGRGKCLDGLVRKFKDVGIELILEDTA